MSRRPTRRTVIRGGAAGLAGASLPACTGEEPGGTDSGAEPGRIDHIVVVMMENRSFDHYLGALKAVEGRDDVDGLVGDEANPLRDGSSVQVHHLDIDCQADPPHGWNDSHNQYNDGANDGFAMEHEDRHGSEIAGEALGYYTREELPVHYALADAFCLPHHFFCSVLGPTWPNRFYGHAGTSNGRTSNDVQTGALTGPNVYTTLDDAGIEWAYYYTDVPFLGLLADTWEDEAVGLLEDFFEDAEAGRLPAFTWIDPGFTYNDDHPPHHPGLGQMFLASIYEALAQSPLWERCLLVITYDEHGGFYDHVAPPEVDDDHADEGFDRMGFRIPTLFVGPWVKQGVVDDDLDNASTLKLVCELLGVEPWNTRIAAVQSASVCLDEDRMASGEPLPPVTLPAFAVPDEEITDDCQYGVENLSREPGSQPELLEWVSTNQPETMRLDRNEVRRIMARQAKRLGLLG